MCMWISIDFVVYTDGSHRHETLSRWDIQMDWPLHGPLVKVPCLPSAKNQLLNISRNGPYIRGHPYSTLNFKDVK